jgi:prepilin-type N-terminal cleavage/methylation domain-containing protein
MVRRARGMTMVEVLVALLVATIGLVGALAMASSMFVSTSNSRQFTEATALAQWKLEEQLLIPGSAAGVWGVNVPDYCTTMLICTPTVPANEPNYYTRYVVWTDNINDGNKTLSITVSWPGANPLHQISVQGERNPL